MDGPVAVVDVDGDGNCGYYALLLGFENIDLVYD